MANFRKNTSVWLLPTVMALFFLGVLSFSLMVGMTYAGRSESPRHTLTYTTGKLTWDSGTTVSSDGAAQLNIFDPSYQNVRASENTFAPGTGATAIVRLKNSSDGKISFTAVLYHMESSGLNPLTVAMDAAGTTSAGDYTLPSGVDEKDVIRAVKGSLTRSEVQDFDITWKWEFEKSDTQNAADTALGNRSAAGDPERSTVGIHIVVTDESGSDSTASPNTADETPVEMYLTLMLISGAVLMLLLADRKRGVQ